MSTKPATSKRSARTKGPNRGQAKSKIVVRRLPANLPEHVFMESIKGLVPDSALDRPTTWVAGKVSKNPVKANTFARAYIYFKNEKLALEFQKAYHGHTFVDRHGNEGKAHVEFAPFQKIPREQRKADTKQGTIEEDPDYIAFLQSLTADPTDAEKEMKLSGTEQLLKESAINPKSTPLLEALRAQKAAAQAKAQAAKLAARQARQAGKAGISNASKVQITILANRNAKDAASKAGNAASINSAASTIKPQPAQSKKAAQAVESETMQGAKPKRERKRRDRASKRAGNETVSTGNTNQQQGDSAPPQITLLKPKSAQGSQSSNVAAQGSGQQEARSQPAQTQSNQGGSNSGGRRGQQNQGSNNILGNSSNNNSSSNNTSTAQTGNSGSGGNAKKDPAQATNAEGGQGRSGRSRRNRGDRAKQDSKSGGDNAAGGNSSSNANSNSTPNANSNSNTNSGSNPGNKPEGQSGGGRSGRNRRGRGGAQENPTTPTAQSQTRHSSALARISPSPGWRHYVIPAVVTQGGLALFGPGIHLEARDLPAHHQHAKPAHPIPYVKTEIIKEAAQDPSFWRRLRQQLEDLWEDYVVHPVLTIWRFGVLALIFLPLIVTAPAVFIGERNKELSDERSGTLWWYSLLVKHMELAGPTFIKLSQWAASRTDIFPTQLCIMLSKLHNQVDPHSIEHTRRTIEAAFGGRKLEDIFDEFIETPLGIGAIAQVYRGRLKPGIALHFEPDEDTENKDDGSVIQKLSSVTKKPNPTKLKKLKTEVAIKVLHPKVARTVERDLAIMRFFANIIHHIPTMRWIALPDQVAMFGEMMQEQLDLRIEAKNLEIFQRNFRERYTVTFPTALKQFATREMLIEEFVDALPLKTILQKGAGPFASKIADIGLDGFLRMLIFDNFVHADLHPGNIFVRFYNPSANNLFKQILSRLKGEEQNTISSTDEATMRLRAVPEGDQEAWMRELECLYNEGFRPQVVFIDAGLISELSDKNRRDFLDLFHALAEFDGYRAGKLMMERCRSPESVLDGEVFALRMQRLILGVKETAMSLGKIKIADLLSEVMAMVRIHHVPMEGDFANVVISILILEGIGRQLNPNIDLFKTALPILRQLGRQDGGRGVVEGVKELPGGGGWWIKMWFLLEARQWAHETLESTTTVDRHLDVLLHPAI
ncbi:hypothetical protein BGZ88_011105 [Linnemannia elongata]|nr:hypothetical protein BGZ88_011105 [Linnemannia elongata]